MAEAMTVSTGALRDTAGKVGSHQARATTIASTAAGAEVTPKSWGLVGLATLYPSYVSSLATVTDHLGKLATAVSDASETLTACAQIYEGTEASFVAALQGVADQLAAIPAAGEVSV